MRRIEFALIVGLSLIAAPILPVSCNGAAAVEAEDGDYWTYRSEASVQGMSIDVSMKTEITDTEGSGASEVFVMTVTGDGDLSGSYEGNSVSGRVTYSGSYKRLVSNFSIVSSNIAVEMRFTMQGETVEMTMGIIQTFSPALDDYIGDTLPVHGTTLVSHSSVTTTTTFAMDMFGHHVSDSDTSTYLAEQTIQISAANETVTVPAGEFECYKYTLDLDMGGESVVGTYYFSTEAGNCVKTTGVIGDFTNGLGDSELKAYSYAGRSAGTSSLSGTTLLIIIAVIALVVIVIVGVLMMRGRGRQQMQMMPPPQVAPLPPPPPPPPPNP